jgi:hypothetical protein
MLNFELTCGIIEGVLGKFGLEGDVKYYDRTQSEFEIKIKSNGGLSFFSTSG